MNTTILKRTGVAAAALTLSFGMAACGSDEGSGDSSSSAPKQEQTQDDTAMASGEFGEGCAAVPESGAGSFKGMSTAPVATAASNNPVLETLVTAVTKAELVDTLELGPRAHRVRARQRRLRRDPEEGPERPARRQAGS